MNGGGGEKQQIKSSSSLAKNTAFVLVNILYHSDMLLQHSAVPSIYSKGIPFDFPLYSIPYTVFQDSNHYLGDYSAG